MFTQGRPMSDQSPQSPSIQSYRFLIFLAMLYVTIIVVANSLIFRMIEVEHVEISSGIFFIPLWFLLADMMAEVYGYAICKKIIWYALFCCLISGAMWTFTTHLPAPPDWSHFSDYYYIFTKQLQVSVVLFFAVIFGGFINAYLIARWKILTHGKYFWFRCIGASWIGQLFFSIVTVGFNFYDKLPPKKILLYICTAYPDKMLITALLAFPVSIIVSQLKKAENITTIDQGIKFNPFVN